MSLQSSCLASRPKAVFNWSGGKDSALALHKALEEQQYEIVALLTTINRESRRSSMHSIPCELLERQAESIGIPLYLVDLTPQGTMGNYQEAMAAAVEQLKAQGVTHFIFGDIFLHDVRAYREKQLAPQGIQVVEPLWGKSSEEIIEEFLASGIQTVIVTTTADQLDSRYIGQVLNRELIASLPQGTDPCGENGEYHTFSYGGGPFRHEIPFHLGAPTQQSYPIRLEDGTEQLFTYWFANLQP